MCSQPKIAAILSETPMPLFWSGAHAGSGGRCLELVDWSCTIDADKDGLQSPSQLLDRQAACHSISMFFLEVHKQKGPRNCQKLYNLKLQPRHDPCTTKRPDNRTRAWLIIRIVWNQDLCPGALKVGWGSNVVEYNHWLGRNLTVVLLHGFDQSGAIHWSQLSIGKNQSIPRGQATAVKRAARVTPSKH